MIFGKEDTYWKKNFISRLKKKSNGKKKVKKTNVLKMARKVERVDLHEQNTAGQFRHVWKDVSTPIKRQESLTGNLIFIIHARVSNNLFIFTVSYVTSLRPSLSLSLLFSLSFLRRGINLFFYLYLLSLGDWWLTRRWISLIRWCSVV